MTRTFWQALFVGSLFVASVLAVQPAAAETLFHRAVSGQGGEKQPIDVVSPTTPYWNFLRVRLN